MYLHNFCKIVELPPLRSSGTRYFLSRLETLCRTQLTIWEIKFYSRRTSLVHDSLLELFVFHSVSHEFWCFSSNNFCKIFSQASFYLCVFIYKSFERIKVILDIIRHESCIFFSKFNWLNTYFSCFSFWWRLCVRRETYDHCTEDSRNNYLWLWCLFQAFSHRRNEDTFSSNRSSGKNWLLEKTHAVRWARCKGIKFTTLMVFSLIFHFFLLLKTWQFSSHCRCF